jgi:DNA-binding response OmpR family regulator
MNKKRILIIDDEEYIIKLLEIRLKEANYECLTCTTTQEGIKAAKTEKPDLIIMDIMLPNITGLEATKILKDDPETKNTPIIILSAKSLEEDMASAKELGADGFISKPILLSKLLHKIKQFLK